MGKFSRNVALTGLLCLGVVSGCSPTIQPTNQQAAKADLGFDNELRILTQACLSVIEGRGVPQSFLLEQGFSQNRRVFQKKSKGDISTPLGRYVSVLFDTSGCTISTNSNVAVNGAGQDVGRMLQAQGYSKAASGFRYANGELTVSLSGQSSNGVTTVWLAKAT